MSTSDQPSEEELRAAYESEIKKIRVEQIVLEQVISLVNLGMRRTGLSPGTEDERDVGQVRTAIEAVRALLPLIEQSAAPQANAIRDALSQLQLAFVRLGGTAETGTAETGTAETGTAEPGTAEPGTAETGAAAAPGSAPSAGSVPSPPSSPSAEPGGPRAPEPEPADPGQPGPAQRSGRLWVPGQ